MNIFEAFAGMGAWSKALKRMNVPYNLLGFSEKDEYAVKGYCAIHNIDETKNIGDITKFNKKIEDLDMFFYSPPCQSWSASGNQLGFNDERGLLFFDALRIIHNSKPKYCIMENVKRLTSKVFDREFNTMLQRLDEEGYNNYWKVLNAKDFNIPQNRERVFIVSIRKDIDNKKFSFPKTQEMKKNLHDILESDAVLPILHNIYGGFKEEKVREFYNYSPTIRTSAGGGHIPSIAIIDDTYKNREQRIYESYSPTIRSGRSGLRVLGDKKIRNLTTLEVMRLMDFDDEDYQKLVSCKLSNTRIYRMCGNSIVVNVIVEILKSLFASQNIRY